MFTKNLKKKVDKNCVVTVQFEIPRAALLKHPVFAVLMCVLKNSPCRKSSIIKIKKSHAHGIKEKFGETNRNDK